MRNKNLLMDANNSDFLSRLLISTQNSNACWIYVHKQISHLNWAVFGSVFWHWQIPNVWRLTLGLLIAKTHPGVSYHNRSFIELKQRGYYEREGWHLSAHLKHYFKINVACPASNFCSTANTYRCHFLPVYEAAYKEYWFPNHKVELETAEL